MDTVGWANRPFVATTRAIVRLDRTLVRAAVHEGSSPYGEPLWSSRWVLPLRRRIAGDIGPGATYWWTHHALNNITDVAFLTEREWAEEMSRLRKIG